MDKKNIENVISVTSSFFIENDYFFPDKRLAFEITDIDSENFDSVKKKIDTVYKGIKGFLISENNEFFELDNLSSKSVKKGSKLLFCPADYTKSISHDFSDLMLILKRLRAKDGCEWDRAQTHESIRVNLIEEAYELLEGIENNDKELMKEECGDVMLQSVFHTAIEEDSGGFDIYDVLSVLCNKLITRHTHIFGDDKASSPEEALKFWEKAKSKEKKAGNATAKMKRIAKTLPALLYAHKLQNLAAKEGLDFENANQALEKIYEECSECKEARENTIEEECGDLLFAVVNFIRLNKIDSEVALMKACDKFFGRFEKASLLAEKDKTLLKDCGFQKREFYWQKAKETDVQNR